MTRIAIFISLIAIVLTFGIIDVQPVAAVSNTGLVGYWSFNEGKGTTATDFSGNGNKGSLVNGPTWVKGRYGKALKFDGVDDYVQVPDSASLSPTSALSVFAWVKPEAVNDYKAIVAKRLSAANDWSYGMRITNTGNGEVEARIHDGTTATSVISSSTLSTGVWYHIGLVYNGSTLKVYINAIERGSGVATVSIQDSDQPLRIGNWTTLTPQDIQHFQGLIDDVRIYNRALSASEIQALYKAGAVKHNNPSNTGLVGYWSFNEGKGTTATDFSGNGNKGSLVNGPTWVKGRYGKALKFDGVDDYVNMGNSLSYSPAVITIGVWIKPASTQSTNGRIVNIQDAANKNYDISILSSTYKIQVINWNGSSASVDITSTNAVQANQWSHIVAIIGNSDNRLYINGKLEASSTSASSQPSSSTLSIGRHLTNGWYFNGLIDDVRIYNRALSASEIQALYKAGAVKHNNPSNTGLVGYWSFNEGKGTTATDFSGNGNKGSLVNGPTWVKGRYGKALKFDGVDDYVSLGTPTIFAGAEAATISLWVNVISQPSSANGAGASFVEKTGDPTGYTRIGIYFREVPNPLVARFGWRDTDAGTLYIINGATTMSTGRWYHVVGVMDSVNDQHFLYLNGVQDGSSTAASGALTSTQTTGIEIGRFPGFQANLLNAEIDDVRVYRRALSAAEVQALYKAGAVKYNQ